MIEMDFEMSELDRLGMLGRIVQERDLWLIPERAFELSKEKQDGLVSVDLQLDCETVAVLSKEVDWWR